MVYDAIVEAVKTRNISVQIVLVSTRLVVAGALAPLPLCAHFHVFVQLPVCAEQLPPSDQFPQTDALTLQKQGLADVSGDDGFGIGK